MRTQPVRRQWGLRAARSDNVHDARSVTVMRVHRIGNPLTLNVEDLRRFSALRFFPPEEESSYLG